MRVFLELERLRNPYSGLGQYCRHLASALMALPEAKDTQWEVLLPASEVGSFNTKTQYRVVKNLYRYFPPAVRADVWHCLHQDSPYLPGRNHAGLLLTIHDLNFIERRDLFFLEKKRRLALLQRKINRASGLVFISNFVKQQVENHLIIPAGIAQKVIYNGFKPAPESLELEASPVAYPYWFSIGLHPKKNYHALLPLLGHFRNMHWVVAGSSHHAYQKKMLADAQKIGVSDRLHFIGPVSDAAKWRWYQHSDGLLFPSLAEGFGLPVIEAMSCGKPVFVSNKTSLPEIGGPEAYVFPDFEPETLITTLEKGMNNAGNDPLKANRMRQWATQFTWGKAAKE
ncbi:MAG: glycosyltransferase family 4 protein, partial [Saprospiraceae bacterium]|nr:glycosyltransferase family 4 protein [Saprospiraceae bacterium]